MDDARAKQPWTWVNTGTNILGYALMHARARLADDLSTAESPSPMLRLPEETKQHEIIKKLKQQKKAQKEEQNKID